MYNLCKNQALDFFLLDEESTEQELLRKTNLKRRVLDFGDAQLDAKMIKKNANNLHQVIFYNAILRS
jgi:hypothetical protein